MKTPFSEKLNPRNELTRLGDINFAGSLVNDVLTKTSNGFSFDAMALNKLSDVVTFGGNLGFGTNVLENSTATNSICIGKDAGSNTAPGTLRGDDFIAIGNDVGVSQDVQSKSISIGSKEVNSGFNNGTSDEGIGYNSNSGGDYSQALGVNTTATGVSSLAIGAGAQAQGVGSIGIGGRYNGGAPYGTLDSKAIVIGDGTALNGNVEENSVVIGASAGLSGAGEDNVIIGAFANSTNGTDQAICINGTGANVVAVGSGLVIKPIAIGSNSDLGTIKRPSDVNFDHYLAYNATTGEIRAVLHGG